MPDRRPPPCCRWASSCSSPPRGGAGIARASLRNDRYHRPVAERRQPVVRVPLQARQALSSTLPVPLHMSSPWPEAGRHGVRILASFLLAARGNRHGAGMVLPARPGTARDGGRVQKPWREREGVTDGRHDAGRGCGRAAAIGDRGSRDAPARAGGGAGPDRGMRGLCLQRHAVGGARVDAFPYRARRARARILGLGSTRSGPGSRGLRSGTGW